MFGELGVLIDDGEKVQCHICGQYFRALGSHIRNSHGIRAAEYKETFGLNRGQSIISEKTRERIREANNDRIAQYSGKFPQSAENMKKIQSEFGKKLRAQGRITLRERAKRTILRPDVQELRRINANKPEARAKITGRPKGKK